MDDKFIISCTDYLLHPTELLTRAFTILFILLIPNIPTALILNSSVPMFHSHTLKQAQAVSYAIHLRIQVSYPH